MATSLDPTQRYSLPTRWVLFLSGMFILSLGVAVTVHAGLGTTTISSPPAVLAAATSYSLGTWTVVVNVIIMIITALILGRNYKATMLWQLPISILFGVMCDVSLWLTRWVDPQNYLVAWMLVILGTMAVALGIVMQLLGQIAFMPGEAVVQALNTKLTTLDFGACKQIVDWTLVGIAVIISLVTMGGLVGVREGTVFAAFGIGFFVRLWQKLYLKSIRRN
ncbi:YczE/YyaS/YitT family protein [Corynebacterium gallinarum]|uniref:YczE/YyaS/YitT family protein n=1 Tax=Corynebacterium gallinarum TaxID=2762214 RepID=UPI00296F1557|nr:DUF6198 family protein [Corynebacterium gallinarum]